MHVFCEAHSRMYVAPELHAGDYFLRATLHACKYGKTKGKVCTDEKVYACAQEGHGDLEASKIDVGVWKIRIEVKEA